MFVSVGVGVGYASLQFLKFSHVHLRPKHTTSQPPKRSKRNFFATCKPDVGLEPTTLRCLELRVSRATDCASRAVVMVNHMFDGGFVKTKIDN
jgi:hypothetical protein